MGHWLIERVQWRDQGYEAQISELGFRFRASRLPGENRWTIDGLVGPDDHGQPSVLHFDNGFGQRHTNHQVTIHDPELAAALDHLAGMVPPYSAIAYGLVAGPFPDELSASLGNETLRIREAYPADLAPERAGPSGTSAPTSPTPRVRVLDAGPIEPVEPVRAERPTDTEWAAGRPWEALAEAPEVHL